MTNKVYIGVRIPVELHKRIQQLQKHLQQRSAGMAIDQSEILRNLLERGINSFEKELGNCE